MAVTPGVRRPPVSSDLKIASKEQFLGPMREAWRDVEDHGHFTQVESRRNLTEHQLREHGLYGRQLAFKLAVIRFFYGRCCDPLREIRARIRARARSRRHEKYGGGNRNSAAAQSRCEPRELSSPL